MVLSQLAVVAPRSEPPVDLLPVGTTWVDKRDLLESESLARCRAMWLTDTFQSKRGVVVCLMSANGKGRVEMSKTQFVRRFTRVK